MVVRTESLAEKSRRHIYTMAIPGFLIAIDRALFDCAAPALRGVDVVARIPQNYGVCRIRGRRDRQPPLYLVALALHYVSKVMML